MQFKEDYLSLHGLVLLQAFVPLIAKWLTIDPVATIFYRSIIAVIALGFLSFYYKKHLAQSYRFIGVMLGVGVVTSIYWVTLFFTPRIGNASIAFVAIATSSLWISFLSPMMTKSKFSLYQVIIGGNAIFGIYMIFNDDFSATQGLLIGIIAAIIGAVVTILNGMYSKSHDHFVVSFYQMIGVCLGTGLFLPIYQGFIAPTFGNALQIPTQPNLIPNLLDVAFLVTLALVFSVFAYTLFIKILKTVSPFMVALTINLSPIYGLLLAYVSDESERMDLYFYSGAIIIVASVMVTPLASLIFSEKAKPAAKTT